MHQIVASLSYVGNGAVAFGERERIAIFSVALRRLFEGEKNGNCPPAGGLGFCFFLAKQKEKKK